LFYCDSNGAIATKPKVTAGDHHLPSRPLIAFAVKVQKSVRR